jgi:ArsR family metal-binding transcriptional regulator
MSDETPKSCLTCGDSECRMAHLKTIKREVLALTSCQDWQEDKNILKDVRGTSDGKL